MQTEKKNRRTGLLCRLCVATLCILLVLLTACGPAKDDETQKGTQGSLTDPEAESFSPSIADAFGTESDGILYVDVLSVGSADCILVRCDGYVLVVDSGLSRSFDAIRSELNRHGITRVDDFVVTHYDKDHIGGAAQLMTEFDVTRLIVPNYVRNSDLYLSMMETATRQDVEVMRLKEDFSIEREPLSVRINVTHLYDKEGNLVLDADQRDGVDNDFSLLVALQFRDRSALLCADAERNRLNEFMNAGDVSFDWIKWPHHGNYIKAAQTLLEKSGADFVVVSAGYEAEADSELLDMIGRDSVRAYYTWRGNVHIATDGSVWLAEYD